MGDSWLHISLCALGLALLVYVALKMFGSRSGIDSAEMLRQSRAALSRAAGPKESEQSLQRLRTHLLRGYHQAVLPPLNLDAIFYPSPAVSERIQSVQSEHVRSPEPFFVVDYQSQYRFKLAAPRHHTLDAYRQATRDQIKYIHDQMLALFAAAARKVQMSMLAFNGPFAAMLDKNERTISMWRPAHAQLHLLQSYQRQISDEVYTAFARLFYSYRLDITPTGAVVELGSGPSVGPRGSVARRCASGNTTPARFENGQMLTADGQDALLKAPRVAARSYADYSHAELERIAHEYVQSMFRKLVDKYKFIIEDMPADEFRARAIEITDTGNELLMHYFINETPTKQQLDDFSAEVEDSMRESLFGILMDNKIDVSQFD